MFDQSLIHLANNYFFSPILSPLCPVWVAGTTILFIWFT